mmetsp:Transcript_24789/g.27585  ORF Transcript_24789/g.27585 Transcript_24789/m.27585 type:complete len:172 (-) Transcript_24789:94-609(-)
MQALYILALVILCNCLAVESVFPKLYCQTNDCVRIGVVGYSGKRFNETKAISYLEQGFTRVTNTMPSKEYIIVSGYTNIGVPKLAYQIALEKAWSTVGVACPKATKYDTFPCNTTVITGHDWGDESLMFLSTIDILVRIGGGSQTVKETSIAEANGIPTIQYDLGTLPPMF